MGTQGCGLQRQPEWEGGGGGTDPPRTADQRCDRGAVHERVAGHCSPMPVNEGVAPSPVWLGGRKPRSAPSNEDCKAVRDHPELLCTGEGTQSLHPVQVCTGGESLSQRPARLQDAVHLHKGQASVIP